MGRSKSSDNGSGSYLSRKEEVQQQKLSITISHLVEQQNDDDDDEDEDENRNGSLQRSKSTKDFWSIADVCWHRYRCKDLIIVFLLFAYVVVAAMVMVILEERAQTENRLNYEKTVDDYWHDFAENLTKQLLNTSDLVVFVDSDISTKFDKKVRKELLRYHEGLLAIYGTKDGRDLEWDFWNATLFGLSLFTTIGYKHLYPITWEGKIATMVLATFGIPLLLTVIQHLALFMYDTLTFGLNSVVDFCKQKWTKIFFKKRHHSHQHPLPTLPSPKRDSNRRVALPFSIGIFLLLSWIFACPLTILLWEPEWRYLDAFYYFFLSFTTVGLDYGTPVRHRYLYLVWLYAVIGLALLSLCFKILYSPNERRSSIEQFDAEVRGYKSASMAAQTDSACIPSDWCVSTMSLASNRFVERSIGPSQLTKVGTPRLPRKKMQAPMPEHEPEREEKNYRKTSNVRKKSRQRYLGDRKYDLICDQTSAVYLAKQEEANLMIKSKDALSGMSDNYEDELRWLSKMGRFSETQSLNEMTMTDAVDEKRFIMAALHQKQTDSLSPTGQVQLALSGDTSSTTATSTTFGGTSPSSQ